MPSKANKSFSEEMEETTEKIIELISEYAKSNLICTQAFMVLHALIDVGVLDTTDATTQGVLMGILQRWEEDKVIAFEDYNKFIDDSNKNHAFSKYLIPTVDDFIGYLNHLNKQSIEEKSDLLIYEMIIRNGAAFGFLKGFYEYKQSKKQSNKTFKKILCKTINFLDKQKRKL